MFSPSATLPPPNATGVWFDPWTPTRQGKGAKRSPLALYHRLRYYKANPRSEEYMKALFLERFPQGRWLAAGGGATPDVCGEKAVVLLYPDAIGLGFGQVEKKLFRQTTKGGGLWVLNGRRRCFGLDGATLRRLRWRRFMETAMLGEMAFSLGFLALTPVLLAWDRARGRR